MKLHLPRSGGPGVGTLISRAAQICGDRQTKGYSTFPVKNSMRYRLRPISVSRQVRRKRRSFAVTLLALLALCFSALLFLPGFKGSAATDLMQLVRLSITSDSGLVKIEIVADGSFDDATVQHFTRGHETVFRV